MKYIRVFRVEHRDGHYGPYVTRHLKGIISQEIFDFSRTMSQCHSDNNTHPCGFEDGCWKGKNSFGFDSVIMLKRWFHGFLENLERLGFVCKEFRVLASEIEYGRSGKQITFKRPLRPVKIHKLSSL